ncbi:XRE family transcriptional regulator, partial [Kitasatospora sp. NPDC059327]
MSYAALATKTTDKISASILSRAASGTVPTWNVTEQFTRACGADIATARRLWRAARWAQQDLERKGRVTH